MKNIFLLVCFFCLKTLQAQDRYLYEFEKLPNVSLVKDYREIEKFKQEATNIFDACLFYTTHYLVNNVISSAIFYRKGDDWIVYETPFGGDRMFLHFVGYSDDKQYAFFQVESISHIARGSETNSSEFYIIDLENATFTNFETNYYQHHWWYSDEDNTSFDSFYSIKSQIIIDGNKLVVLESDFHIGEEDNKKDEFYEDFGLHDSQSGIYEIQDQKIVKTHYYDSKTKRMKPIIYAGEIAIGMVLRDIMEIYNPSYGIELKEVPQFTYGYDSEEIGYELWVSDKPLYFMIISKHNSEIKRIKQLTVLSPEISVQGFNTGMSLENILNKYPKAKLNIDLINDWEFIFIKELNVKFVFKTNNSNRIGFYPTDFEDGTRKIKRPNVTIDFIQI